MPIKELTNGTKWTKAEPEEIWKDIHGFEDRYSVSNLGRVYSKWCARILHPEVIKQGYLRICLTKQKVSKRILMHRLVAEHFIPNPLNLPEINHIDLCKTNNKVENLEWCTRKDNMIHAYKSGIKASYGTLNKTMPNKKSSKYLHVYYRKSRHRFLGILTIDKKTIRLGSFKTDLDAAMAVDKYIKQNGLNLKTNFHY